MGRVPMALPPALACGAIGLRAQPHCRTWRPRAVSRGVQRCQQRQRRGQRVLVVHADDLKLRSRHALFHNCDFHSVLVPVHCTPGSNALCSYWTSLERAMESTGPASASLAGRLVHGCKLRIYRPGITSCHFEGQA